jgi:hypothetical protein
MNIFNKAFKASETASTSTATSTTTTQEAL